jgi:hypothetical protein
MKSQYRSIISLFLFAVVGSYVLTLYLKQGNKSQPSRENNKINVVFGMAKEIQIADLTVFVASWRTFSPQTHIVLWIDMKNDVSIQKSICQKYNCECIDWKDSKYGKRVPEGINRVINARNFLNLYYLEEHPEVEYVVASDTRDAFIQDDPFKYVDLEKTGFIFSMEGSSEMGIKMEDQSNNKQWVIDCFGDNKEVFQVVSQHPVICCGVQIAPREQMILFYKIAAKLQEPGMFMHKCRDLSSTDTTIQHAILYLMRNSHNEKNETLLEMLKNFKYTVMHNFESPVYTVGIIQHNSKYDSGYKMVRISKKYGGEIPPIVHQYDRFGSVIPKLRQQYPSH